MFAVFIMFIYFCIEESKQSYYPSCLIKVCSRSTINIPGYYWSQQGKLSIPLLMAWTLFSGERDLSVLARPSSSAMKSVLIVATIVKENKPISLGIYI